MQSHERDILRRVKGLNQPSFMMNSTDFDEQPSEFEESSQYST